MTHFIPHNYQLSTIATMVKKKCQAIFLSPGLGKTVITLRTFVSLRRQKEVKAVLVIAPLRAIYSTWQNEIAKWSFSTRLSFAVLHGKDKALALERSVDVYLINFEGMKWLFETALKGKRELPFDMLVVDESGKFKNPSSKRLKLLKPQLNKFNARFVLNGTPAPNSLMDIWSQLLIVDKGELFGKRITHYRQQYFHKAGYMGYDWEINGSHAKDAIYKRTSDICIVMDAADCLDLPPTTYNTISVVLPPSARAAYTEVEKELFLTLDEAEDGGIEIKNMAVATGHCRQLASGNLYRPLPEGVISLSADKRDILHFHDAKLEALLDLVEELQGQPVLVGYDFYHSLNVIKQAVKKRFGFTPPHIGSGVSGAQGAKLEQKWNTGELKMLLGHPQSMGTSLNLQHGGHDIVWYDQIFNLYDYQQFNLRIAGRQGVKQATRIHHLVAEKTVDEVAALKLQDKATDQQTFKDAVKEYRRNR